MNIPDPDFTHLMRLTGPFGTFEHAQFLTPRVEHGYCTDDVARVLIVSCREGDDRAEMGQLSDGAIKYLLRAQDERGLMRNRRTSAGEWTDSPSNRDCWGRAMWAFGTAAALSTNADTRRRALEAFERGSRVHSRWTRAVAFAALGALEVLRVDPGHQLSWELIHGAIPHLYRHDLSKKWNWPEDKLRYANAALPDALLGIGLALNDADIVATSLRQLRWLLKEETRTGVLSVTPTGGRSMNDVARPFDQQPIEVAAMADACARAWHSTHDVVWSKGVTMSVEWFLGENIGGSLMYNVDDGGGYDGLTALGPNLNQGAESTLALLSTLQHARQFASMSS